MGHSGFDDAGVLASAAHFAAGASAPGHLVAFVPFSSYVPLVFVCLIMCLECLYLFFTA